MAKPKYFRNNTSGVVETYLQWDEFDVAAFRNFVEAFRPDDTWTVEVQAHAFGFYKAGTLDSGMAPGDWAQFDTWSSSGHPSIVSDASLRASSSELFEY